MTLDRLTNPALPRTNTAVASLPRLFAAECQSRYTEVIAQ
jgi:hypothetical protein